MVGISHDQSLWASSHQQCVALIWSLSGAQEALTVHVGRGQDFFCSYTVLVEKCVAKWNKNKIKSFAGLLQQRFHRRDRPCEVLYISLSYTETKKQIFEEKTCCSKANMWCDAWILAHRSSASSFMRRTILDKSSWESAKSQQRSPSKLFLSGLVGKRVLGKQKEFLVGKWQTFLSLEYLVTGSGQKIYAPILDTGYRHATIAWKSAHSCTRGHGNVAIHSFQSILHRCKEIEKNLE